MRLGKSMLSKIMVIPLLLQLVVAQASLALSDSYVAVTDVGRITVNLVTNGQARVASIDWLTGGELIRQNLIWKRKDNHIHILSSGDAIVKPESVARLKIIDDSSLVFLPYGEIEEGQSFKLEETALVKTDSGSQTSEEIDSTKIFSPVLTNIDKDYQIGEHLDVSSVNQLVRLYWFQEPSLLLDNRITGETFAGIFVNMEKQAALYKNSACGVCGTFKKHLPYLARNTALSPKYALRLYDGSKSPQVLRAIALQERFKDLKYKDYLSKISTGKRSFRIAVVRNKEAFQDEIDAAFFQDELVVMSEYLEHIKPDQALLKDIYERLISRGYTIDSAVMTSIARYPNTPEAVLEELSHSSIGNTLSGVMRSNFSSPQAVDRAYVRASLSPNVELRTKIAAGRTTNLTAKDKLSDDIEAKVLVQLTEDENQAVRKALARNPKISEAALLKLANDSFAQVAKAARYFMHGKFPELHAANQASWIPIEELNESKDLEEDFETNLRLGNIEVAKKLYFRSTEKGTRVSTKNLVNNIVDNAFDELKFLIKLRQEKLLTEMPNETDPNKRLLPIFELFKNQNLKVEHVKWVIGSGLEYKPAFEELYRASVRYNNLPILKELGRIGYFETFSDERKREELSGLAIHSSMITTDEELDFVGTARLYLDNGFDPYQKDIFGYSAVDMARIFKAYDLLAIMDIDNKNQDVLIARQRAFPDNPDAPIIGIWQNESDSFRLMFKKNGAGKLNSGIYPTGLDWKEVDKNLYELSSTILPNIHIGDLPKEPDTVTFNILYRADLDQIEFEKGGVVFSRVMN